MLSQETSEEAAAELLHSYQETLNIKWKKQNKTKQNKKHAQKQNRICRIGRKST